jgi:uncharacterized protein (DUF58 family)
VNALRAAILRGSRATPRGGSARTGARPGDGFAFSQLRAYAEGDDQRRIDHAATARAGALQTRVYLEETVLVLAALADESGSMTVGRRRPLAAALAVALRALPRGASLLAIADGFDLPDDEALRRAAHRFDATLLLARDPWRDDLPLRGVVRLRDAESGRVRRAFVGARERARYRAASQAREAALRARFRDAGWRVGMLDERDGRASLLRTFGVPA